MKPWAVWRLDGPDGRQIECIAEADTREELETQNQVPYPDQGSDVNAKRTNSSTSCLRPHAATTDTEVTRDFSSLLDQVAFELHRLGLRDAGVLVGVSGGADSVALLRSLHALAEPYGLRVVAAHLNHGMRPGHGTRPGAADDDAAWTAELCGRLGVPIVLDQVDVPAYAGEHRLNLEEAARAARYQFFDLAARGEHCTYVTVAHTADDQVETVLHHLFRGTGLAGLRGMRAVRPLAEGLTLVRPLLRIPRTQIEDWLGVIGQDYRTDITNADTSRTRSRIRHSVLPRLNANLGLRCANRCCAWRTRPTNFRRRSRISQAACSSDASRMRQMISFASMPTCYPASRGTWSAKSLSSCGNGRIGRGRHSGLTIGTDSPDW